MTSNINDLITHALFADGCAVSILSATTDSVAALKRGKIVLSQFMSQLSPANEDDGIALLLQHNGITCKLSPHLPDYIFSNVQKYVPAFLQSNGMQVADIDHWLIHPGGVKIVQRSADALQLRDDQTAVSWNVLERYGNVLSNAILFCLHERFFPDGQFKASPAPAPAQQGKSGSKTELGFAFSFAPGVSIEGFLFKKLVL